MKIPGYFHSPLPGTGSAHSLCFRLDRRGVVNARSPVPPSMVQRVVLCGKRSSLVLARSLSPSLFLSVVFRGDDVMPDACASAVSFTWSFSHCSVGRDTFNTHEDLSLLLFVLFAFLRPQTVPMLYFYACSQAELRSCQALSRK